LIKLAEDFVGPGIRGQPYIECLGLFQDTDRDGFLRTGPGYPMALIDPTPEEKK